MRRPKTVAGTRLCIAVRRDGVTAYGNKAAFETLSRTFKWLAKSPPSEHYELHSVLDLQDYAGLEEANEPQKVFALFTRDTKKVFEKRRKDEFGIELTFMMVEESDLDDFAKAQSKGLIPKARREQSRTVKACSPTTLDKVAGSLRYRGKAKTLAEMDAAITAEVKRRHRLGEY